MNKISALMKNCFQSADWATVGLWVGVLAEWGDWNPALHGRAHQHATPPPRRRSSCHQVWTFYLINKYICTPRSLELSTILVKKKFMIKQFFMLVQFFYAYAIFLLSIKEEEEKNTPSFIFLLSWNIKFRPGNIMQCAILLTYLSTHFFLI